MYVSRGVWRRNQLAQTIGIETRWRAPELDQISKNPPKLIEILDNRNVFHLGAALRTHPRIDFDSFLCFR